MQHPLKIPRWLAPLLVALLVGGGVTIGVAVDDDGTVRVVVKRGPTQTVPAAPAAIAVDGPDADTKRDDALPLDAEARDHLEDLTANGRGDLDDADLGGGDKPTPTEGPLAAQSTPGCRTRFVRNQSSRNGADVSTITLHQTVSTENGWSSQDALTALANRSSSGVSWNYLIGRSGGRCTYTVPLTMKSWAAAGHNPQTANIEVEATGRERSYVEGAGRAKLIAVMRYISKREDVPLRRALVVNCRTVRSGVGEHSDLGQCGGGHRDVCSSAVCARDGIPEVSDWQTAALIAEAARAGGHPPRTKTGRSRCSALRYHRRRLKAGAKRADRLQVDGGTTTRGRRIRYLRETLQKNGVATGRYCVA